ncbi:aldehyde dehydrogenase family protein [Hellea balneolensis]|uniref:aldehyde dehydrogenase family protein n=1 Tax=Hellea balneolensis TaxID=287478 RepID=UPI0004171F0C|nr:aldehyde dehydrogenase family protein [Hellea balneolensis]
MFQKMLINGELVGSDSKINVLNPATEEVFAAVPKGTKDDINNAVSAAKNAFPAWAARPESERQGMVNQMADVIASNADMLARLMTQEQGKPLAEAMGEMAWAEGYLRHYATLSVSGRTIQDDDDFKIQMRRVPLGVVAGICPWNFPVLVPFWKIGPALISGNTIVVKPAPTTPVTILKILELCNEFIPAGVVNIVTDENDLGPLLTGHPDVAKVSFTGSTATGKKIMSSSSGSLKRVTLELGGNDPSIVMPDVNVPETAAQIYGGAFLNAGQVCLAVKRAYVHEDIYDDMCDELGKIADAAIVGDGLEQGVTMGPIQNKAQYELVKNLLESAKKDGKIVSGGVVENKSGYFIRPTIVRDVTDGDDIVDLEQFGPVLPVIKYTDLDDAVSRANNSDYGLGASVWSSDVDKAADVAVQIESGSVWVNQHINIGPHIPMAGFKSSGIGVEQSAEGLEEYTQVQVLNIAK